MARYLTGKPTLIPRSSIVEWGHAPVVLQWGARSDAGPMRCSDALSNPLDGAVLRAESRRPQPASYHDLHRSVRDLMTVALPVESLDNLPQRTSNAPSA